MLNRLILTIRYLFTSSNNESGKLKMKHFIPLFTHIQTLYNSHQGTIEIYYQDVKK